MKSLLTAVIAIISFSANAEQKIYSCMVYYDVNIKNSNQVHSGKQNLSIKANSKDDAYTKCDDSSLNVARQLSKRGMLDAKSARVTKIKISSKTTTQSKKCKKAESYCRVNKYQSFERCMEMSGCTG